MLRHKAKPVDVAGEVVEALRPYADQLANDPKLRRQLAKAIRAAVAAGARARRESDMRGATRRFVSDPLLLAQVTRAIVQLERARKRVERPPRKRRTSVYVIGAAAVGAVVLVPAIRAARSARSAAETTATVS